MRYPGFCILIMLLFLSPSSALALDFFGQSRTYVLTREKVDASRLTRLSEYLNFSVSADDETNATFSFGGWYRHDLVSESSTSTSDDDLQYAYVSLKRRIGNGMLNLGRVLVHEGAASEQIDGMHARTDLKAGFTVAAFGGSPVETVSDGRQGDSLVGGRIAQGLPGRYLVGISYLDEKNGHQDFRREGGLDLWLRPLSRTEVQGISTYNAIDRGWMQHRYSVVVGPFGALRLIGEYTSVDYKQYFASATLGVFQFSNLDPNEKITTAGGSAEYAVTKNLTAVADYAGLTYAIAGRAEYYGGKIRYGGPVFSAGFGFHRMDGATDSLAYDEYTAYTSWKSASADLSLRLVHLDYKREISGFKTGDSASAAAGYAFTPKTRVTANVEYARNPDYNSDVRAMLTFVYRFDTAAERISGGRKSF